MTLFVFYIILELALCFNRNHCKVPVTSSIFPLILMVLIRFFIHKTFCKAFRTSFNLIKIVIMILMICLTLNMSLAYDKFT